MENGKEVVVTVRHLDALKTLEQAVREGSRIDHTDQEAVLEYTYHLRQRRDDLQIALGRALDVERSLKRQLEVYADIGDGLKMVIDGIRRLDDKSSERDNP